MITVPYSDVLNRSAEVAGRTRDKLPSSEAIMLQGFISVDLAAVWNKALWPELIPDPVNVTVGTNRQFSKNEYNGPAPASTITANLVYTDPDLFFTITTAAPHGLATGAQLTIVDTDPPSVDPRFIGTWPITVVDATTLKATIANQGSAFGTNGVSIARPQEMGDVMHVLTLNPLVTTKFRPVEFEEASGAVRVYAPIASVWVDYVLPRPDLTLLSGTALSDYAIPARFSAYLTLRAGGALLQADGMAAGTTYLGLAETALLAELDRIKPASWRDAPTLRGAYARGVCH